LVKNLLLSLCAVVLFLVCLEGVCRLLEPSDAAPAVAHYITDWADWEGDFYTVKATAAGWPPFEDYNHDGLRDREHNVAKPPGVRRLVCLGDSTTAGYRIRPEDAYPQVLQDLLDSLGRSVEVFNVALGGWSTHQELLAYRRLARKYHPDVVLVGICLNDVPELGNNLSRPPAWLAFSHRHSALVRRLVAASDREIRSVEELIENPEAPKMQRAYARLFETLRTLRDEVHADGAELRVLVFPFRLQIAPDAPPPTPQEEIAAFCADEGIHHLDLLPAIRAAGEEAFVDYDHLSPLGEGIIADQILRAGFAEPGAPVAGPFESWVDASTGRPATTPELVERLADTEPATRTEAVRALAQRAKRRDVVLVPVAARLGDKDEAVRAAAAWALGRLGPRPGEDLPVLAARLEDEAAAVRGGAAWAIGQLGTRGRSASSALVARLNDSDVGVRRRVVEALERVEPDEACLPEVLRLLEEGGPGRAEAARVVGLIGASAAPAVPALAAALRAPEPDVRREAVIALQKIGPGAAPAVPALIEAMGDPELRWRVPDALGSIGPPARSATDALTRALRDPSATVRWRAALALGSIRPDDKRTQLELARLIDDPQGNVRLGAILALARIEADADLRLATFHQAFGDSNVEVRRRAAWGVGRMGPAGRPAVPELLEALHDHDDWARMYAARALGKVAEADPPVMTALKATLEDPADFVRAQAEASLRQISARNE
jgi:HEAT repeat protein/lysophospholipase L1-like esterase